MNEVRMAQAGNWAVPKPDFRLRDIASLFIRFEWFLTLKSLNDAMVELLDFTLVGSKIRRLIRSVFHWVRMLLVRFNEDVGDVGFLGFLETPVALGSFSDPEAGVFFKQLGQRRQAMAFNCDLVVGQEESQVVRGNGCGLQVPLVESGEWKARDGSIGLNYDDGAG